MALRDKVFGRRQEVDRLRDRVKDLESVQQKALGFATGSPILMETLSLLDGSLVGYGTVYEKILQVRAVVDFVANAVATTPLKVYQRAASGRPEVRDHPLARTLRNPHPSLTPFRLVFGWVADLAVYGNAYTRVIQRPNGTVWLEPLPPFRVTPKLGDLVAPGSYDFIRVGAAPITYSKDEILHFKLYHPEDRRIGSSKLDALRNVLLEEVEASKQRRGFWQNGMRAEGWIETSGPLTDEQLIQLRGSVESRHSGSENAGHVGILPEGYHFVPGAFSPKDAEFVDGRKLILETTAQVFGLPLSLLGLTETSTYASEREKHKELYADALPPWFEEIASTLELQLFPWFKNTEDLYTEFLVEAKLRGSFQDQIEYLVKALGGSSTPGILTPHEGRDLLNLPDLGDPRLDRIAVPLNISLEGPGAQPALPAPAQPALPASSANKAAEIVAQFDRQGRSVLSGFGAGKPFDLERWNREFAPVLGSNGDGERLAERENLITTLELAEADDPVLVFDRAKAIRAPALAEELSTPAEPSVSRRVIRDASNRIIGIEDVGENKAQQPMALTLNVSVDGMKGAPITIVNPDHEVNVPVQLNLPETRSGDVNVEVSQPDVHFTHHSDAPEFNLQVPVQVNQPDVYQGDVSVSSPVTVNTPEHKTDISVPVMNEFTNEIVPEATTIEVRNEQPATQVNVTNQPPEIQTPVVNVKNEITTPPVEIDLPDTNVTVNQPDQNIEVNLPEQPPAEITNVVNTPEQPPTQVTVNPPETKVEVNVPKPDPPKVEVKVPKPRKRKSTKRVIRGEDNKIIGVEETEE